MDVLASPIVVCGMENGEEIEMQKGGSLLFEADNLHAVVTGYFESRAFVFNTTTVIEPDGFMTIDLKVVPRVRRVAEIFKNVESIKGFLLENLCIKMPINPEISELYHLYIWDEAEEDKEVRDNFKIGNSDILPDYLKRDFKSCVWIGNEKAGLTMCCENEKGRTYQKGKAIEIKKEEKETVFTTHLYERLDFEQSKYVTYLKYRFSLQATPVKPIETAIGEDRVLHIDCFKKIPEDYHTFLFRASDNDPTEINFDRIKRLGVNLLILHEKWNQTQNHQCLSVEERAKVKHIVEEAHKRGIRVLPYFGYELSTLAPEFYDYIDDVKVVHPLGGGAWYRQVPQRDYPVCYNSSWHDKWLEIVKSAVEYYDFDGVYLDSTVCPWECCNENHGCGWRDEEGKLHSSFAFFAVRNLMKALYEYIDARGGIVYAHNGIAACSSILSYVHYFLAGEELQYPTYKGIDNGIPKGHARAHMYPENFGVPGQILVYTHEDLPQWNHLNACSNTLLLGLLPHVNDIGEPLEQISKLWNVFNLFGVKEATFNPYWSNNTTTTDKNVYCSYFKKPTILGKDKFLIVSSNIGIEKLTDIKTYIPELDFESYVLYNALTGEKLVAKDCINLSYKEFSWELIVAEPKNC